MSPASSVPGHHHHDHHGDDVASDDDDGAAPGGANKARAYSHRAFVDRRRVDAKAKAVSIHSIQQEIKSTRNKIKTADDEYALCNQDTRQLERIKMEGERQVEAKRRECEAESQRNRGVREAVQVARANSGTYAQQIAEKVSSGSFVGH